MTPGDEQFRQDHLQLILEMSGEIVYRTDAGGRITQIGPAVEQILGYTPEDLVGSHYLILVDPDSRAELFRFYAEQAASGQERSYREFPAAHRNGRQVWIGQHVSVLRDGDAVVGYLGVASDLTVSRQASSSGSRHEHRLETLRGLAEGRGTVRERMEAALARACDDLPCVGAFLTEYRGGIERIVASWPLDGDRLEGEEVPSDGEEADYVAEIRAAGRTIGRLHVLETEESHAASYVDTLAAWAGVLMEQRADQQRGEAAERSVAALTSRVADGVLTCSVSGTIRSLNAAGRHLLGLEADGVGDDVRLYFPGFLHMGAEQSECDAMRAGGESFRAVLGVEKVNGPSGPYLLGVFLDASREERERARILRREAALQAFMLASADAAGTLSLRHGKLTHLSANGPAREIFRLLRPGSGGELAAADHLDRYSDWERACGQCLADGASVRFDTTAGDRNLEVSLVRIEDDDPAPRFAYVATDKTPAQRLESDLKHRSRTLEGILRAIPFAAIVIGRNGLIESVNHAFEKIFGTDAATAVGGPAPDALSATGVVRLRRHDGTEFLGDIIRGEASRDGRQVVLVADVSDREHERHVSSTQQTLLAGVRDAVVVLDHELRITFWNSGAEALTGFSPQQAEGRRIARLTPFRWMTAEEEQQAMDQIVDCGSWQGRVKLRSRRGGAAYVDARISMMKDPSGEACGVLVVATDVSRIVELERKLRHAKRADSLTGLPNRSSFLERIIETDGGAVVVADLERFEQINRSHGRSVGDAVLQQFAARLQSVAGPEGSVARVEGDSFAILARGSVSEHAALELAAEVRRCLEKPFRVSGQKVLCSARTGVALFEGVPEDPERLLGDATLSLAEWGSNPASRQGAESPAETPDPVQADTRERHPEVFRPAVRERAEREARVSTELASSVERDELEIRYEPMVSLSDGSLYGFEAKVHWSHPEFGAITADEFMLDGTPGALAEVMASAAREVVAQRAVWQSSLSRDRTLAVHLGVSAELLSSETFREAVRLATLEFELPHGGLVLEVREARVDVEQVARFQRWGVAIWSRTDSRDLFSKAALDAEEPGHPMRAAVTGIGSEEDLGRAREAGYRIGQGALFSEPRTVPHIERLLRVPGWLGYWRSEARRPDREASPSQRSAVSPNSGIST